MDVFADEIGMDPAELRRRNMIAADRFPFTTPVGSTYDIGDYEGALDRALEASEYKELRAEQERLRRRGIHRGIGFASFVEVTNPSAAFYGTTAGPLSPPLRTPARESSRRPPRGFSAAWHL